MKKFFALLLAIICVFTCSVSSFALSMEGGVEALKAQFAAGEGPAVGDYLIDYSYYSPVKKNDTTKYPLVVWLHGMGDGSEPGKPVAKSNIAYWSSDEFQARFKPAGGAFILAARSHEEDGIFWDNSMLEPLRAAIDDFIAKNKANIDLGRIYVGGYSMGGKMTLKMAVAYPEMFAAAFPICPAWSPSEELIDRSLKDMPIWITSSTRDPLVNYYLAVTPTWENIVAASNIPEECRFSTLTKVCFEDGTKTDSSHHAWFAVNHDLFSAENGDYPYMTTVNGKGEEVKLTYPDGMISWLTSHTSDYDGAKGSGTGNIGPDDNTDSLVAADGIFDFVKLIFNAILKVLKIK